MMSSAHCHGCPLSPSVFSSTVDMTVCKHLLRSVHSQHSASRCKHFMKMNVCFVYTRVGAAQPEINIQPKVKPADVSTLRQLFAAAFRCVWLDETEFLCSLWNSLLH